MPKAMPKPQPVAFVRGDLVVVRQTFNADFPELELLQGWTGKVSEALEGGMLQLDVEQLAASEASEVFVHATNVCKLARRAVDVCKLERIVVDLTQPAAPPAPQPKKAPMCLQTLARRRALSPPRTRPPLGAPCPPPGPPPKGLVRDHRETRSREVLARHVCRLAASVTVPEENTCPGENLEQSVLRLVRDRLAAGPSTGEVCWRWTQREDGVKVYRDLIRKYTALYKANGLGTSHLRDADARVLASFQSSGRDVPSLADLSQPRCADTKQPYVYLPVSAIRFAHDRQSETFGRDHGGREARGVLQLAIQMLRNEESPYSVEAFRVTYYQGLWYSSTGNRRLAALKLWARAEASIGLAPEPIRFRVAKPDATFTTGGPGGRAKLTTVNAGLSLHIKETDESVANDGPSFGADLLAVLTPLLRGLHGAGA